MQTQQCNQVRRWLVGASRPLLSGPPDPALSEHVATCPFCRGALTLLTSELWHIPTDVQACTCDECQHNLAAFIDTEREEGIAAAIQEYPALWWHLWTCKACAETYHLTTTLLEAKDRGELARPPFEVLIQKPTRRLFPLIQIPRVLINRIGRVQPLLGIAWGAQDGGVVIIDQDTSGYHMTLSMQQDADTTWNVIVQVAPPLEGQAILTAGASTWQASFNATGEAMIVGIPATLFTNTSGPNMIIEIKPDQD